MADADKLGALEQLIGTWEGDKGVDVFPPPLGKPVTTKYREQMTFTAIPPTKNPPLQTVYALRYLLEIDNLETGDPMHQETGYWFWTKHALGGYTAIRAMTIPHGIAIMAGGHVDSADAEVLTVSARAGSDTFGILNNHYLEFVARTTAFSSTYTIDGDTLSYDETSTLDYFHLGHKEHTDSNVLQRTS